MTNCTTCQQPMLCETHGDSDEYWSEYCLNAECDDPQCNHGGPTTMTPQELMAAMKEAGRLSIVHIGEPNRITIVNDFTGRETTVDTSRPMTARRALEIRRRLCPDDCTSGDTLGARGPQADGYRELLDRADRAILTTLEGF